MTPPVIAAFYAGLNGLILLWLTALVIRRRFAGNILLGDGGDKLMIRLIRGHGNAAETIPMTMILLALAELIGAPAVALHLAGLVFTIGRLMHGLHFAGFGGRPLRFYGMVMTLLASICLALGLTLHAAVMLF